MPVSSELDTLRQRTGLQDLMTREGLTQFQSAIRHDLGAMSNQWNTVLHPLLTAIAEPGLDALSKGLSGNVLWSDVDAATGVSELFYDSASGRKRTIKESFDWLLVELSSINSTLASTAYVPEDPSLFADATSVSDMLTVLAYGSGAFSLDAYPDLDGVLWLNAGTWEQAQADDAATGAGSLKAIQLQTNTGVKFMLRQGKAVLDVAGFDAAPSSGDVLYLSEVTAGNITATEPSASGQTVQAIGYCLAVDGSNIECYIDIRDSYYLVP